VEDENPIFDGQPSLPPAWGPGCHCWGCLAQEAAGGWLVWAASGCLGQAHPPHQEPARHQLVPGRPQAGHCACIGAMWGCLGPPYLGVHHAPPPLGPLGGCCTLASAMAWGPHCCSANGWAKLWWPAWPWVMIGCYG